MCCTTCLSNISKHYIYNDEWFGNSSIYYISSTKCVCKKSINHIICVAIYPCAIPFVMSVLLSEWVIYPYIVFGVINEYVICQSDYTFMVVRDVNTIWT